MKKSIGMLMLIIVGLTLVPACTPSDSLEEVAMESNQEVSLTTDDEDEELPKPND